MNYMPDFKSDFCSESCSDFYGDFCGDFCSDSCSDCCSDFGSNWTTQILCRKLHLQSSANNRAAARAGSSLVKDSHSYQRCGLKLPR